MNRLWTTYLLIRNPWLVFFMQLLMHPSHVQVRDIDWMLKSMTIHQKDIKRIVKSNFVVSCLDFKGSILIERHVLPMFLRSKMMKRVIAMDGEEGGVLLVWVMMVVLWVKTWWCRWCNGCERKKGLLMMVFEGGNGDDIVKRGPWWHHEEVKWK